MGYSGWRFSCDRGTLERCAGALEIKGKDESDAARAAYIFGAAAALPLVAPSYLPPLRRHWARPPMR